MSLMLAISALLLKILGVVFLFAAALGVMRFSDPFQRMHAATKAGTLGASLVVVGVIIEMAQLDALVIGLVIVIFLLITIPIAGHLLGRACYVSGAEMTGAQGGDALAGNLERSTVPLEERQSGTKT